MGIMNALFFRKDNTGEMTTAKTTDMTTLTGNHNLTSDRIFKNDGGFTPNQNNFEGLRSVPVVDRPRYFSRNEALALKNLESEKCSQAKWSKRAYKSLKKIDDADTSVVQSHYNYANKIASNETEKQAIKGSHAKHLHKQRPKYAEMNQSLEQEKIKNDQLVSNAIASIKSSLVG